MVRSSVLAVLRLPSGTGAAEQFPLMKVAVGLRGLRFCSPSHAASWAACLGLFARGSGNLLDEGVRSWPVPLAAHIPAFYSLANTPLSYDVVRSPMP